MTPICSVCNQPKLKYENPDNPEEFIYYCTNYECSEYMRTVGVPPPNVTYKRSKDDA